MNCREQFIPVIMLSLGTVAKSTARELFALFIDSGGFANGRRNSPAYSQDAHTGRVIITGRGSMAGSRCSTNTGGPSTENDLHNYSMRVDRKVWLVLCVR